MGCGAQSEHRMLTPLLRRCGELMDTAVMSDRPEELDKETKIDMETSYQSNLEMAVHKSGRISLRHLSIWW